MLLSRDALRCIPSWPGPILQDQHHLREWKALTGQGQKPNSQILLPEPRGSLKQAWWNMPVSPALWMQRQEDAKFESSLSRRERLCFKN